MCPDLFSLLQGNGVGRKWREEEENVHAAAVIPVLGSRFEECGILQTPVATGDISLILKVSRHTKCFCAGDKDSSEIGNNNRCCQMVLGCIWCLAVQHVFSRSESLSRPHVQICTACY